MPNQYSRSPFPEYFQEDRGYSTPCWIWRKAVNQFGYGKVVRNGKQLYAHRAYYFEMVGPLESGLFLDHLCRVRCCVNPDHLEAVSSGENTRRGLAVKISGWKRSLVFSLSEHGISGKGISRIMGFDSSHVCVVLANRNRRARKES